MTVASQFDKLPGGWLAARRTLVLVGHLPVMSGLWLSQYADREARESGPVCLVRLASDSVQLELFRTGSRRPSIRPQATYEEALRAIAPTVSHWLIVPSAAQADALEIPDGTDDIVVLTGADQAAIVAAYKLVKAAHEAAARSDGARPAISVAVLGADPSETAHVAARIGEAAGAALSTHIPVRGGLQRVAPVESSFRGTFDDPSPAVRRLCEIIAEASGGSVASMEPAGGAASTRGCATTVGDRTDSVPQIRPHPLGEDFRRTQMDHAPLRFVPRTDRRAPAARGLSESIPFRTEPPARRAPAERVPPVRTPPGSTAPRNSDHGQQRLADPLGEARSREVLAHASSTLREQASRTPREATPSAQVPVVPPVVPPVTPSVVPPVVHPVVQPTRGAYHASAIAGPSVAPPIARIVDGGLPESLVVFVPGLERIDHVAPRCERVEFAVEQGGRLHLVCRVDDLRMLERARVWLRENGGLFRRAYPEIACTDDPVIDVFVAELHDLAPIEGATMHMIRQLEFAGRRCFDVQTLSA
jgi:hypothetical protein